MRRIAADCWEYTLACPAGERIEYKYTRGAWNKVEKGARGEEISNRILTSPATDVVQLDTVRNWSDIPVGVTDPENSSDPEVYQLLQNFPNPFNASTIIRYGLPCATDVVLSVHNMRGQQVAILVQGLQKPGFHEIRLDAAGLAAGLYFYKLKAGNFEATRKFLLLR